MIWYYIILYYIIIHPYMVMKIGGWYYPTSPLYPMKHPIYIYRGMSENGVYPQWNSHLVGIMISKTIGFRGTQHFQTNPYIYIYIKSHDISNIRPFPAISSRTNPGPTIGLCPTKRPKVDVFDVFDAKRDENGSCRQLVTSKNKQNGLKTIRKTMLLTIK